jgi:hypothetical protein
MFNVNIMATPFGKPASFKKTVNYLTDRTYQLEKPLKENVEKAFVNAKTDTLSVAVARRQNGIVINEKVVQLFEDAWARVLTKTLIRANPMKTLPSKEDMVSGFKSFFQGSESFCEGFFATPASAEISEKILKVILKEDVDEVENLPFDDDPFEDDLELDDMLDEAAGFVQIAIAAFSSKIKAEKEFEETLLKENAFASSTSRKAVLAKNVLKHKSNFSATTMLTNLAEKVLHSERNLVESAQNQTFGGTTTDEVASAAIFEGFYIYACIETINVYGLVPTEKLRNALTS